MTLGGGEPTLHPRWDELGKRLTDHGVRVNLITNGWHWTEAARRQGAAGRAGRTSPSAWTASSRRTTRSGARAPSSRVLAALDAAPGPGLQTSVVTPHQPAQRAEPARAPRSFLASTASSRGSSSSAIPRGPWSEHQELVHRARGPALAGAAHRRHAHDDEQARPPSARRTTSATTAVHEKALRDRGAEVTSGSAAAPAAR